MAKERSYTDLGYLEPKGALETSSWYVVITTKPPNMKESSYNKTNISL